MLNLKKIAITGSIASGKSTVSSYLKQKNAYIVDADEIGHQLLNIHSSIGQQIIDLLGRGVVTDGRLDRKKIALIVFNDRVKLKALEKIIHPQILQEIEAKYENLDKDKFSYFVVDIPLLYEMKHEKFYDYVLLVDSKEELCKKRFEKQGFLPKEYNLRMKNQISLEDKRLRADFIIPNNGSLEMLENEIEKVMHKINQI